MANIEFFLSGGPNNSDPNKSLGGEKSGVPIIGELNNLYPDITTDQAEEGITDYRCFYMMNTGSSPLNSSVIYVSDENPLGSDVLIGIQRRPDVQRISLSQEPTSGSAVFLLGSEEFSVPWQGSNTKFAEDIQAGLLSKGFKSDVNFTLSPANFSSMFTVSFSNESAFVNWPTIKVKTNSLSGNNDAQVRITTRKVSSGAPLNSVADAIATPYTAPSGVQFVTTGPTSTIQVGTLAPGEFVPVWSRRLTNPGTEYVILDYFSCRVTGSPL